MTDEMLSKIDEEIRKAAPAFEPAHALQALDNTNVYLFRYFPKLKMIVATERLCRDFHVLPVYQNMPYSFSRDFVSEEDQAQFEKMYHDIDAGAPSASVDFKGKVSISRCHVTLTTVEWDADHQPELCTGVVENRTKEELFKEELNSILSSISCGILQYRYSDNALLRANRAALDILGYDTMEDLSVDRENGVVRTVLPEDRQYIKELVDRIQTPGEIRTFEYRVKHKNSEQIRYCYGTVQVFDNVHGERVVQRTIMDITDRKLKEDMQHANDDLMQRLDAVMSGISGGFEITLDDPVFTYVFLSESIAALQGYTVSELLKICDGKVLENIYPDDRASVLESLKDVTPESGAYHIKYRVRHKDGSLIWISESGKKVIDQNGASLFYCLIQDITRIEERNNVLNAMNVQQKEMLAEIRKERQQYREALVSGSEYAYRFDVTEGIVHSDFDHSTRGSLMENLGISTPINFDVMVQRWLDVVKPEFLTPDEQNPMTTTAVKACYERGLKHIVTEYFSATENKYYRRTLLLSEDDETGHLWAIAIINDITNSMREETRMRNELAMINRDLRNQINISKAFSSIYFASWEINLETKQMTRITVPDWADEVQQLSQGNYEDAAEIMNTSFIKPEWQDPMRQFLNINDMAARLKNENILSCECQVRHYGWSSTSLIPFMRDEAGNVLRVLLAVREIDNEKRLELEAKHALEEAYEAANRANSAKTNFLSSVSHDIRTPMNGIIGMTTIASTHLDDKERVADCLSKISISSKHLLGLINEVLDMNKIESGKLDLNVEQFPISELIDTLLIMSKPQIESKKHKLSVNIQNLEHEYVIGDGMRLQQVFVNLLSNAIKYTPEGGKIRLNLREMPTNNPKIGCFEFVIEDNGIGMSEEFLQQLFEPFTRAQDQRISKIQGSGLGMAIARNIVRMMNGDIQVESELSKGTRFTVTVYLELQDTGDDFSAEDFQNLSILVVDDELIACESTCSILNDLGMQCEWVLSGEEAIEKATARHEAHNDYFAIILDLRMPEMDGVAAAKAIRAQIGEASHLIIMSAYDWSEIEQEARSVGVNSFISKPVFKSRVAYLFKNLLGHEPENPTGSMIKDLSEADYSGKRALLVEDNELNAEIAQELLGATGLEIEHALDGKEAVDRITEHPEGYYDIVFMDVQMPVMNGYEATQAIRSLPGAYEKEIPIIAMTANAFVEDVQTAKNAGMNEHVAKPLNIAQLIQALERWLK